MSCHLGLQLKSVLPSKMERPAPALHVSQSQHPGASGQVVTCVDSGRLLQKRKEREV